MKYSESAYKTDPEKNNFYFFNFFFMFLYLFSSFKDVFKKGKLLFEILGVDLPRINFT